MKSNPVIAFGVLVLLITFSVPIARRVARSERDPRLYSLVIAAAVTHLFFTVVQIWVVNHVYHGIADYTRYLNQAAVLGRHFDRFDFSVSSVGPILGNGSVGIAGGVVMAIVGVNKLATMWVFSWLAFLATVCFYKAFAVTFPDAARRRYAYLVFFWPSILFWTAGLSKETMMFIGFGVGAYGAALILAHRRGGAILLVIGTVIGIYVRPQEILLFLAAFAVAGLFRRKSGKSLRGVRRLLVMALQAALLIFAVALSQQLAKKAPVFNLNQLAQNARGSGQGSTVAYHPGPAGFLNDVYTVLLRPLPFNAHGNTQRVAALENTLFIILVLTSLRRIVHLPRAAFVRPYVMMSLLFTIAFPYAFAALANLGLIDRERVMLWPFLLVLLALPISPRGSPPILPWEASAKRRQRAAQRSVWSSRVPARR